MDGPDELDENRLVQISGTLSRTYHVSDQEQLNRGLMLATLPTLHNSYEQRLVFSGVNGVVQFPGPARAQRGDAPEPFQIWEWAPDESVRFTFDVGGELPWLVTASTFDGAEGVQIDARPFQLIRGYDESRQWFIARVEGFLRDTVEMGAVIVAPTAARRDQLVAGVASVRVVASPDGGA